jgi:hypothetical protein
MYATRSIVFVGFLIELMKPACLFALVYCPLGLMSVKCHEKFKNCMRKVKKAGKVGFSVKCPYEMAMATMTQGMDMAIMLSQLGSHKLEL